MNILDVSNFCKSYGMKKVLDGVNRVPVNQKINDGKNLKNKI